MRKKRLKKSASPLPKIKPRNLRSVLPYSERFRGHLLKYALELAVFAFALAVIWGVLYIYQAKCKRLLPKQEAVSTLLNKYETAWQERYPQGYQLVYAVPKKIVYEPRVAKDPPNKVSFADFNKAPTENDALPRVEVPVFVLSSTSVNTFPLPSAVHLNQVNVVSHKQPDPNATDKELKIEIEQNLSADSEALPMESRVLLRRQPGERRQIRNSDGRSIWVEYVEDAEDKFFLLFGASR
ncbi:MAG: hypothetical protein HQL23_06610 [Candidatus Omnitrophica bacterium]|nr:hypothetical protein [Candidatus Omnitrophota bacterium]